MSDAPITPRSNAAVPDTTVPMATKPGPGAQPATAPMNARATQMSAAVGPGAPPPQSAAAPFVSEEISGVLIAQESTQREQAAREAALREAAAAAARQAPPRRIGASTLESRLVPLPATAEDGSSAPLPPLPAVIDVGAPAHAFVAKSAHAPPPMPYGPGTSMAPHGYPHGGHAHAHGPTPAGPPGARASASTSTMALVVVGVVVGLLAIAAVVLAVGVFAARRNATVNRPSRPTVTTASPGAASEPPADAPGQAAAPLFPMGSAPPPAPGRPAGAAATQTPRPVRK